MINRTLIRIKVVQLLYSYLLVENQFSIESQPESPTREKRFAYALYLEVLAMMTGIAAGIKRRGGDSPLYETRFIQRIVADERVRSVISRRLNGGVSLADVERLLTEKVKESALYKKFLKSENPGSLEDERIWEEIFNLIIKTDPQFNRVITGMENYSLSGVERMEKLMEATFTSFYSAADRLPDALKTLRKSMEKARELYFRLLDLPARITALRAADIEERRKAFLASDEDRNPNLRFVDNALTDYLAHNAILEAEINRYGTSLSSDDEPMLRSLLNAIMASDIYKEYMEFPVTDFERDCEFWRNIYRQVIFANPDFLEALEDKSVFWNDDLDIMGTFVIKTVKKIADRYREAREAAEGRNSADEETLIGDDVFLPMYKDDEDSRFGAELFTAVVENRDTYREYIHSALDRKIWEAERMAYMDVVIMMTATAEMLNFPKIPLNVTLNEYIDIVKCYSTEKSSNFVNALLRDMVGKLQEAGVLRKTVVENRR